MLTYEQAKEAKAKGEPVHLVHQDTTGNWVVASVWLDEGELVMGHPTEARGTVAAPRDGSYGVPFEAES